MIRIFISDYERYIEKKNNSDGIAFAGSNMTNYQYLTVLKQVSEVEYSLEQTAAIRIKEIHPNAIKDYIANLDNQFNSLKELHEEIKTTLKLIE